MTLNCSFSGLLAGLTCCECAVRQRAFCAGCCAEEMRQLNSLKSHREYAKGQTVCIEGRDTPFLATVVAGIASRSKSLKDGRTQIVGLIVPSEFIGNPLHSKATFTVTAEDDLLLCTFDRADFERLIDEMPGIARQLAVMKYNELDAVRDWMMVLGRKTARERVASFLMHFARKSGRHDRGRASSRVEVSPGLTRQVIADFLGMTTETVSRHMNRLRREGLIDFRHGPRMKVLIHDTRLLHAESGDDAIGDGWS